MKNVILFLSNVSPSGGTFVCQIKDEQNHFLELVSCFAQDFLETFSKLSSKYNIKSCYIVGKENSYALKIAEMIQEKNSSLPINFIQQKERK